MRKSFLLISLALLGLVLYAWQAREPSTRASASANSYVAAASKEDPKVVAEIKELLAKHDKALNDKSLDVLMTTFSADANTVVLGTGQGERFVGQDAIKQAYTEIFKDYDPGTLVTNCDWKTGGADKNGEMAWLAATCQATDSMKGAKREYVLNVSATVVKQAGGWRFVMLHMSNANNGAPPPQTATGK